ncbi:MAG: carbamoyltransferase HypF [Pirellulaceae bacterium]
MFLTTTNAANPTALVARRVLLRGFVQGRGVRPAVFRLARELGVGGFVANSSSGVEIHVEGEPSQVTQFLDRLPAVAHCDAGLEVIVDEKVQPSGALDFHIRRESAAGPLAASVPRDLAVCDDCRREVFDVDNRRRGYAFTSCTQCGPRYSIIERMPYERSDTTMERFGFCASCQQEYTSADARRFHAQTNACGQCGPQVWASDAQGRNCGAGDAALTFVVDALRAGRIVAVKGLGGYQLLVDACDEAAVQRLRRRKQRAAKPLAVMVTSVDAARRVAHLDQAEVNAIMGAANPIVVLRAKAANRLASSIHPGLDWVGVMLPTTPLHALIAERLGRPLVCTSGNRDGEPLACDERAAEAALSDVCDVWLHHDRPIARPIDDSVIRVIAGRPVSLRLARGLAPLPLALPTEPAILALGGHMKSAAAWSNSRQAVLGPHVGDLDTLAARERWLEQLAAWRELYRFQATTLVHDLHPDYFTTTWAASQSQSTLAVQHHHGHIVAGMLQQGWLDRQVLGVAWDGTGFGPDGTIWGGEFLIASARGYHRAASLRPFRLPGGEAAVRQPWRVAAGLVAQSSPSGELQREFPVYDVQALLNVSRVDAVSPVTSSAGRLFDAAAHLILGIERVDFEGQAAMMLESAADRTAPHAYRFSVNDGGTEKVACPLLDWRPLVAGVCGDRRAGVAPGVMAMKFHRALARGIAAVCRRHSHLPVVLGGGVFQNRLLTELVVEQLADHPQPLGLPGVIPPGDGGLAAGQLAVALMNWENA